jgi:hypothetical protein
VQAVSRLSRRDRSTDLSLMLLEALLRSSALLKQVPVRNDLSYSTFFSCWGPAPSSSALPRALAVAAVSQPAALQATQGMPVAKVKVGDAFRVAAWAMKMGDAARSDGAQHMMRLTLSEAARSERSEHPEAPEASDRRACRHPAASSRAHARRPAHARHARPAFPRGAVCRAQRTRGSRAPLGRGVWRRPTWGVESVESAHWASDMASTRARRLWRLRAPRGSAPQRLELRAQLLDARLCSPVAAMP